MKLQVVHRSIKKVQGPYAGVQTSPLSLTPCQAWVIHKVYCVHNTPSLGLNEDELSLFMSFPFLLCFCSF